MICRMFCFQFPKLTRKSMCLRTHYPYLTTFSKFSHCLHVSFAAFPARAIYIPNRPTVIRLLRKCSIFLLRRIIFDWSGTKSSPGYSSNWASDASTSHRQVELQTGIWKMHTASCLLGAQDAGEKGRRRRVGRSGLGGRWEGGREYEKVTVSKFRDLLLSNHVRFHLW